MNYKTEVAVFKFNETISLSAVMGEDEPLFIAKHVAEALGYSNTSDAIQKHCKKAQKVALQPEDLTSDLKSQNATLAQKRSYQCIPESDVFRLIMRSKLESAEDFQDWVVEEVLPSIRKRGVYLNGQEQLTPATMDVFAKHLHQNARPALTYFDRESRWVDHKLPEHVRMEQYRRIAESAERYFAMPKEIVLQLGLEGLYVVCPWLEESKD